MEMGKEVDMSKLTIEEQKLILNSITPRPGKKYDEIDRSGTHLLYDEIREYLNNWEKHTKAGLELRKRQSTETIKICEEILNCVDFNLSIFDKEDLIKDRSLFIHLSERISICLDRKQESSYIIKNDDETRKIFEICKDAIDCDYSSFRKSIETADFNLLNIQKQNIIQDLTFRLSGMMGQEWYSEVCKKMKWKKAVCSGHGTKLAGNPITNKLDRILKRPKRGTIM